MSMTRRDALGGAALAGAAVAGTAAASPMSWARSTRPPDEVFPLWPGPPPGGERVRVRESVVERPAGAGLRDRYVAHTTRPTLSVFRPERPNGTAMLIIPGGGYQRVVIDKEGFETARWLNSEGVTCFVLTYRLPGDGWAAGPDAPLQDAQRAIRLIRARGPWSKLGALGFSAGGHLCARLETRFDLRTYAPVDAADAAPPRPDFAVLGYPVVSLRPELAHPGSREEMLGRTPAPGADARYSAETDVPRTAPPTFLVHAADDTTVPVANSLVMFQALHAAGVPVEMHIFQAGGHGFGLRAIEGRPVQAWPELLLAWMRGNALLPAAR